MRSVFISLSLLLASCIPAGGFAQVHNPPNMPALVTVVGEYKAQFEPDELSFSVQVRTEGADLLKAKQDNAERVRTIIAYLTERGVASKDIQTQYLNLSVQYRDQQQIDPRYVAMQTIQVILRDIGRFDELNTGLLQRGITGLNGPNFSYSKADEARASAGAKAVLDAKQKATALAEALGQKIGPAFTITEEAQNTHHPMVYRMEASMDSGSGPGIAVGEIEIATRVTVAFYLLNQ